MTGPHTTWRRQPGMPSCTRLLTRNSGRGYWHRTCPARRQWHGDSLTRSQTGRHSWSKRQRKSWTGSGGWRRSWGGCRQSKSPARVARLAAAQDTAQTSPVQEQSALSATHANSQDTSLVLPSAQAPAKTPRQGLGRGSTRRRRRRSGRWLPTLRRAQTRTRQTPRP